MKKSRFTEEQIVFALKQAELGTSVPEVCRLPGYITNKKPVIADYEWDICGVRVSIQHY